MAANLSTTALSVSVLWPEVRILLANCSIAPLLDCRLAANCQSKRVFVQQTNIFDYRLSGRANLSSHVREPKTPTRSKRPAHSRLALSLQPPDLYWQLLLTSITTRIVAGGESLVHDRQISMLRLQLLDSNEPTREEYRRWLFSQEEEFDRFEEINFIDNIIDYLASKSGSILVASAISVGVRARVANSVSVGASSGLTSARAH